MMLVISHSYLVCVCMCPFSLSQLQSVVNHVLTLGLLFLLQVVAPAKTLVGNDIYCLATHLALLPFFQVSRFFLVGFFFFWSFYF